MTLITIAEAALVITIAVGMFVHDLRIVKIVKTVNQLVETSNAQSEAIQGIWKQVIVSDAEISRIIKTINEMNDSGMQ